MTSRAEIKFSLIFFLKIKKCTFTFNAVLLILFTAKRWPGVNAHLLQYLVQRI